MAQKKARKAPVKNEPEQFPEYLQPRESFFPRRRASFFPRRRSRYNSETGKLYKLPIFVTPAELDTLAKGTIAIWSAFASVKAAIERHYHAVPPPVAHGADIRQFQYGAKPKSGLDTGQRGAMKEGMAGRRSYAQQQGDDARAHQLLEDMKDGVKRRFNVEEIDFLQGQVSVRTTSTDIKKRRELRMGFEPAEG